MKKQKKKIYRIAEVSSATSEKIFFAIQKKFFFFWVYEVKDNEIVLEDTFEEAEEYIRNLALNERKTCTKSTYIIYEF